jgi:hypothetical protein
MSLFKTLTDKPWERKGIIGGLKPEGAFDAPSEKIALSVFLVVASVGFFSIYRWLLCSHGIARLAAII